MTKVFYLVQTISIFVKLIVVTSGVKLGFWIRGPIIDKLENYLLCKVFKTDTMTRNLHYIVFESDLTWN